MAKQTFTTGQVLTAAQMTSLQQTAMLGGDTTAKTTSYVLVAADAGTTVAMNAAGATTITVNTGLFAAGDIVFIQNRGAGICTITAGTATVATAGSLALPQHDAGILYFTSASAAVFYEFVQTSSASALVGCRITQASGTSQTITNVTFTDLTFDSETYDTDGFHDNVTNNARITIPSGKGGKYDINGHVEWSDSGTTGAKWIRILKNNTDTVAITRLPSQNGDFTLEVNTTATLVAGDYITLNVYQNKGSNVDVYKRTDTTYLSVTYLGA